jgi:hypothetical protein
VKICIFVCEWGGVYKDALYKIFVKMKKSHKKGDNFGRGIKNTQKTEKKNATDFNKVNIYKNGVI